VYPTTEGVQSGPHARLTIAALAQLAGRRPARTWVATDVLGMVGLPSLERRALRAPARHQMPDIGYAQRRPRIRGSVRLAFEECWSTSSACACCARRPIATMRGRCARRTDLVIAASRIAVSSSPARRRRVWNEVSVDLERLQSDDAAGAGRRRSGQDRGCGAGGAARGEHGAAGIRDGRPPSSWPSTQQRNFMGWPSALGLPRGPAHGPAHRQGAAALAQDLASGAVQVARRTHAPVQKASTSSGSRSVIVDEQHRFGGTQRMQLREKGRAEAATRTAGDDRHADPAARSRLTGLRRPRTSRSSTSCPRPHAVRTVVLPEARRDEVVSRIDAACRAGRQA